MKVKNRKDSRMFAIVKMAAPLGIYIFVSILSSIFIFTSQWGLPLSLFMLAGFPIYYITLGAIAYVVGGLNQKTVRLAKNRSMFFSAFMAGLVLALIMPMTIEILDFIQGDHFNIGAVLADLNPADIQNSWFSLGIMGVNFIFIWLGMETSPVNPANSSTNPDSFDQKSEMLTDKISLK